MSALEQDLDDLGDDLNDYLMGDEPDWDAAPEPPQDADETNRRLRRLAKVRAEQADVEARYQAETQRIQEWMATRMAPLEQWHARRVEVLANRERWLTEGLEMWHRAVLADDPARKTISLPCGTLKSRTQPPVWEFDEAVFCVWAKEHAPDLVRVRLAPDRAAAKQEIVVLDDGRYITGTGEVVPGVTVTVRGPSFTVTTDADGGE